MNCPVCPNADVAPEALACPNCGVDLTPIRRLQELGGHFFNEGLTLCERKEYSQALEKLMAALELDSEPARVNVLIGKLLWQMGKPEESVGHWRRALEKDPDNFEAKRLLEIAGREQAQATGKSAIVKFGFYGTAVVAFLALWAVFLHYRSQHKYSNDEVEHLRAGHSAAQGNSVQARNLEAALGDLAEQLGTQEGIRTERITDKIKVSFLDGLFLPGSDALTGPARSELTRLAELFARQGRPMRLVAEGCTDDVPPDPKSHWPDNWTLGLARAQAVVGLLRQHLGGSQVKLLVTSSGPVNPPFPNDTAENRRKNRTVVLYVLLEPSHP